MHIGQPTGMLFQKFFGPLARIVGIDIDPRCKAHEATGINVRVGDQGNEAFLQSVIDEFGIPDVVLDDGSHRMDHISKSFDFLYPKLPKNGVYMVEDLHTAYWEEFGGVLGKPESFINRAKAFVDHINADHSRGAITPDYISRGTFGISFYDSIVVLERGEIPVKEAIRMGSDSRFSSATSSIAKIIGN